VRATGAGWALGIRRIGSLPSGARRQAAVVAVASVPAVAVSAFLAAVCVLMVGWFSSNHLM